MKKQNRTALTKLILMIALTLGVSAVSASAQSYAPLRFKVPFEFTLGGETLPADTYTFQPVNLDTPNLLLIRGNERHAITSGFTSTIQANKAAAQTKLVFHKYGDQYFLSEIWMDGDDTGHRFLKSHAERELNRGLARNFSRPEMVAILVASQP